MCVSGGVGDTRQVVQSVCVCARRPPRGRGGTSERHGGDVTSPGGAAPPAAPRRVSREQHGEKTEEHRVAPGWPVTVGVCLVCVTHRRGFGCVVALDLARFLRR